MIVDDDVALAVQRYTGLFEAEIISVRPASRGDEEMACFDIRIACGGDADILAALREPDGL